MIRDVRCFMRELPEGSLVFVTLARENTIGKTIDPKVNVSHRNAQLHMQRVARLLAIIHGVLASRNSPTYIDFLLPGARVATVLTRITIARRALPEVLNVSRFAVLYRSRKTESAQHEPLKSSTSSSSITLIRMRIAERSSAL